MIERKDGETDASWIGRLEAAYKALIPACESANQKLAEAIQERSKFAFESGKLYGSLHMKHQEATDLLAAIRADPNLGGAWKQRINSLLTPPPQTR